MFAFEYSMMLAASEASNQLATLFVHEFLSARSAAQSATVLMGIATGLLLCATYDIPLKKVREFPLSVRKSTSPTPVTFAVRRNCKLLELRQRTRAPRPFNLTLKSPKPECKWFQFQAYDHPSGLLLTHPFKARVRPGFTVTVQPEGTLADERRTRSYLSSITALPKPSGLP